MAEEDLTERLYEKQAADFEAAHPRVKEFIREITGWNSDKMATWIVEFFKANQGGSEMQEVKPPCVGKHMPLTIPEVIEMLVGVSGLSADHPIIQAVVKNHRQRLIEQFGL